LLTQLDEDMDGKISLEDWVHFAEGCEDIESFLKNFTVPADYLGVAND